MGGYTIVNLGDVDDSAASFGLSGTLEARFLRSDVAAERSGVSRQRLRPNTRLPFGHRHRDQEELYVVTSGSGWIKLDDDVLELRAGDVVRIAPEVARSVAAGPDGLELYAFGAGEQGDVEMLGDVWGEGDAVPAA